MLIFQGVIVCFFQANNGRSQDSSFDSLETARGVAASEGFVDISGNTLTLPNMNTACDWKVSTSIKLNLKEIWHK